MAKNIKGRKFVATAASAALVASAIVPVASAAVEFSDAGQISDYAKDAVNYLVGEEIINGLGDGSFGPKGEITRAQAATIFTKALKLDTTGTENFSDVNADDWFFSAVVGVANAGIVNGMGDGTFAPENKLTRAQAAKMIVEAYKLTGKADLAKYTDAAGLQTWAADALAIAVNNGIMKGNSDTTLNPEGNITREDFAVMVKRAIDATQKETETKEIAVTSVSAINNTTFELTASFSEELKAADLAGKTLTLKSGDGTVTATATFKSVSGTTAVFTVNTADQAKLINGAYSVTSDIANFTGKTTSYSAVITGNYVEGFVFTTNGAGDNVPVVGATVKVADLTTTTNADGYYKIATNAGQKTVEISKGNEFFYSEESVPVQRNYSTVNNVDLVSVNVASLKVEGTVLNEKNAAPLQNVEVVLQAKNASGQWADVTTATTDANGKYTFTNNATTTLVEFGKEYQVVFNKKVSATNLDNVFKTKTQTFKTSTKSATSTVLTQLTEVKEISAFNVDLSWVADLNPSSTETVKVEFINQDGKEILETSSISVDVEAKKLKNKYDLVDKKAFANDTVSGTTVTPVSPGSVVLKPRLESGTYFLKVTNGSNAIAIVPVTVTEGGSVEAAATIEKAFSVQASTIVDKVQYNESLNATGVTGTAGYIATTAGAALTSLDKDGVRTAATVAVGYDVYQTVAGKQIYVTTATPTTQNVLVTGSTTAIQQLATLGSTLAQLSSSNTYTVKATSPYVTGTKEFTVKPDAAVNSKTLTVDAAAHVKSITVKDSATSAAVTSKVTVNNIKLIKKDGTVVAQTGSYVVTPDANGDVFAGTPASATVFAAAKANLAGIKAGEYKIEVDVAGYKVKSTDAKKIYDFQDAAFDIELEKIKAPIVTGYVRFADNGATVDANKATIIAYDKNGDAVAGVNLTGNVYTIDGAPTAAGAYDTDGILKAGETYTFVVRGEGFETKAITRTVQNGENAALNFDVQRGALGYFKYTIVDSNNANLETTAGANVTPLTITDSYYDKVTSYPTGYVAGTDYFDVTGLGSTAYVGSAVLTTTDGKVYESAKVLPKDSYVLSIVETKNTNKYSTTITLNEVNGTEYGTIKVPAKVVNNALTAKVTVNLTGTLTNAVANDIDYVVIVDQNGKIVDSVRNTSATVAFTTTSFNVGTNAKYQVRAYFKGGYVGTADVTVQDFDQTVSIAIDAATR